MRERLIQSVLGLGCATLMGCAARVAAGASPATGPAATASVVAVHSPATLPAVVQPTAPPAVEKHEPVPPPPLTAAVAPATEATPLPPASQHAPNVIVPTTQPGPIADQVAYAMGYAGGARIRARLNEDGRPADDLQIISGMIAGLDNRDPAFPREDMQAAFAQFQAYSLQRRAEKQYADDPAFRKRADDNMQKSRAVMDQNAQLASVEVLPDGVQRVIIKPGNGRIVGNAKFLTVNLKVSLADGTLVKATEAEKPQRIAVNDCLPALIDASRGMKVGGSYRLLLPPEKAYGLAGKPPVIGPNEAIEYDIELLNAE